MLLCIYISGVISTPIYIRVYYHIFHTARACYGSVADTSNQCNLMFVFKNFYRAYGHATRRPRIAGKFRRSLAYQ